MTDLYAGGDMYGGLPKSAEPITYSDITPQLIRQYWDRSARSVRHERNQAALNEQFIRNRHWLHMNPTTGRLEELPRNPERVRATVARIGPDSHRLLSKLTSRPLTFEVPPTSADDMSMQASRVAEAALHQTVDECNWEDIRYDHAAVAWTDGVGGIAVEWDHSVGVPVLQDPETGRWLKTGGPKLTAVGIHEIGLEPGTRDPEHSYWWIRGQALPPAEVQQHYGLDYMPEADARAIDAIWRLSEGERTEHTPLTMVYTYFERPSDWTDGMVVTIVGDEIVQQTPWPFRFRDRLNLALATVWPVHGRWYGHTPVSDAVPLQTALNASWSSIIEHMKQSGNARLWVPEGSVDDVEDLSDLPGEAVEYNPLNGQRPTYEAPPVMPEWWIRQPAMLGDAMDHVLSQQDISRGVAPSGIESGIALSVLSENADTPIGRFGKNLAGMWGRVASMVLELYAQHVRETRTATIRSPYSKVPEVVQWNGDLIAEHTSAIVPPDSMVPRGRNAQMAYAFQLHDRGLVQDPVQLAKIADLPDQAHLLEAMDSDTARAVRENAHMAAGTPRTVDAYDDHGNHIRLHRDFMRSERYENLDPQIQQYIRWHMAAHEQYAAFQAAQMAQANSISPIAGALPQEAINPIDPNAVQQQMAIGELTPSAMSLGGPGAPPTPMGQPAAPPSMAGGPPVEGGATPIETEQEAAQAQAQDLQENTPAP